MTAQETHEFNLTHPTVEQTRPIWKYESFFKQMGIDAGVTVLVCQKNTKQLIQLCLESILRFYPDIQILVVNDNSTDNSTEYLKFMELTNSNVKAWHREGDYFGHGMQLDLAIKEYVNTPYALIIDSDIMIERGGAIELMLQRFNENHRLYAIGTMQYSSRNNNGGEPDTPDDAVPYANPQFSIYHIPTYKELDAPFITDGTPCILNMKAAEKAGLDVEYFPTDKYVTHNSGSSWCVPQTVWTDDHDVKLRPFITFIIPQSAQLDFEQDDNDFDFVVAPLPKEHFVTFTDGTPAKKFTNNLFDIRFNVHGEYVVDLTEATILTLPTYFVSTFKKKVIEWKVPDQVWYEGLQCTRRRIWQRNNAMQ